MLKFGLSSRFDFRRDTYPSHPVPSAPLLRGSSSMAQPRNEDLFAESSMSFGEHLEELRTALVRSLLGLVVGFLIGLYFGYDVVDIIKSPLEKSLATYYKVGAVLEYESFLAQQKSAGLPVPYTLEQVQHLVDKEQLVFTMYQVHPSAVRTTLGLSETSTPASKQKAAPATTSVLQATSAANTANTIPKAEATLPVVESLTPLFVWQPVSTLDRASIKGLSAQEAFMIYLKASLMAGVIIASPWIFYQLWIFVAAGLYPAERRFVHVFLPISLGLFLAGAAFCFFIIFQFVLDYLFKFNRDLGIAPDPRINEWLGFAIFLPVGFGLSFQLPLVMLFLNRIGVMSVENYLSKWKIAVLVIFVIAMILTPAEPISMLAMAIPLTALYFGGILICKWAGPRKNPLET